MCDISFEGLVNQISQKVQQNKDTLGVDEKCFNE
jgi:hypothetical protein